MAFAMIMAITLNGTDSDNRIESGSENEWK